MINLLVLCFLPYYSYTSVAKSEQALLYLVSISNNLQWEKEAQLPTFQWDNHISERISL